MMIIKSFSIFLWTENYFRYVEVLASELELEV